MAHVDIAVESNGKPTKRAEVNSNQKEAIARRKHGANSGERTDEAGVRQFVRRVYEERLDGDGVSFVEVTGNRNGGVGQLLTIGSKWQYRRRERKKFHFGQILILAKELPVSHDRNKRRYYILDDLASEGTWAIESR
ncbi:hypothetical protein B0H11DRAFT_1924751 [Mycena galericulata]|nr:hypothetical protein B0H11DRAFT_1924751 [Mycena galericulata]